MDLVQKIFGNDKKGSETAHVYPHSTAEPPQPSTLRRLVGLTPDCIEGTQNLLNEEDSSLGTAPRPTSVQHKRMNSSSLLFGGSQRPQPKEIVSNPTGGPSTAAAMPADTLRAGLASNESEGRKASFRGGGSDRQSSRAAHKVCAYPNDAIALTGNGVEFSGTTSANAEAERRFLETGQTAAGNFVESMKRLEGAMEGLLVALDGSRCALKDLIAVAGQTSLAVISSKGCGGVVARDRPPAAAAAASPSTQDTDGAYVSNNQGKKPPLSPARGGEVEGGAIDDHPCIKGYQQLQDLLREYEESLRSAKKSLLPCYRRQLEELCTRPVASVKEQLETVEKMRDHRRQAAAEVNAIVQKIKADGGVIDESLWTSLTSSSMTIEPTGTAHAKTKSIGTPLHSSAALPIPNRVDTNVVATSSSTTSTTPVFVAGGKGVVRLSDGSSNNNNNNNNNIFKTPRHEEGVDKGPFPSSGKAVKKEDIARLQEATDRLRNIHILHNDSLRSVRETELYTTAAAAQSLLFTIANAFGQLSLKLTSVLNTSLPQCGQTLLPEMGLAMGVYPMQKDMPHEEIRAEENNSSSFVEALPQHYNRQPVYTSSTQNAVALSLANEETLNQTPSYQEGDYPRVDASPPSSQVLFPTTSQNEREEAILSPNDANRNFATINIVRGDQKAHRMPVYAREAREGPSVDSVATLFATRGRVTIVRPTRGSSNESSTGLNVAGAASKKMADSFNLASAQNVHVQSSNQRAGDGSVMTLVIRPK